MDLSPAPAVPPASHGAAGVENKNSNSSRNDSGVFVEPGSPIILPHTASPAAPTAVPHTLRELFTLFAVSFSYALLYMTLANIVVPKEVQTLAETSQTTWTGVIVGSGALAQIATPIVGALSDRAGVREPYLRGGTLLIVAGVGVLFLATQWKLLVLLFVSYLLCAVGLSAVYAIATTLLADYVAEEQTALGSAVMGTEGLLGAGVGYALFAVGISGDATICIIYASVSIVCFAISVSAMASLSAANNPNINNNNNNNISHISTSMVSTIGSSSSSSSSCAVGGSTGGEDTGGEDVDGKQSKPPQPGSTVIGTQFRKCFEIVIHALTFPSPTSYPDFALACTSRAFFNSGLALQNFMLFFFRDVAVRKNGSGVAEQPDKMVARLAVLALLGGLLGAVPAGMLADKFGPKIVIATAAAVCICSILSFPFLSGSNSLLMFDLVGLVAGVGQSCFLVVDYGLGVKSLPKTGGKPSDAAKDLGVFALSATAGALVGQLSFAGILERFSGHVVTSSSSSSSASSSLAATAVRYEAMGFNVCFVIASGFFVLSGICACLIKTLR